MRMMLLVGLSAFALPVPPMPQGPQLPEWLANAPMCGGDQSDDGQGPASPDRDDRCAHACQLGDNRRKHRGQADRSPAQ